MIEKLLKYSISNLWDRKSRSLLTIISIMVGITSVYALLSFGQGIQVYINELGEEQGLDKLLMQAKGFGPPGTSSVSFSEADEKFLSRINGVQEVVGYGFEIAPMKFKKYKEKFIYVISTPTDSAKEKISEAFFTVGILKGRALKKGDINKVTVGYSYMFADKVLPKALALGDKIQVNDIDVEIVGFYEQIGNPGDDSNIYLTYDGMEHVFDKDEFDMFYIQTSPGANPITVADRMQDKFRKYRGQEKGEEDFSVQTFEQVIETFSNIILMMNGVLVLIALISVVVAAVNIMNTMYTSVLDRTREIGLMKAVGAENKTIMYIFVIESGILGIVGGILGILLGFSISKLGQLAAVLNGLTFLKPVFPLWLTIGALVFAFLVGAGSGILPSMQAAKLKPVDALRYE